ncbi:Protein tyrosine kinase/Protein kinase domain containing protein [Novymonas esmeraldas]|uniref:Protein tyrosine kinase/Protein kinase domain containing protein n=1 Tax=Novymonas esmeraldas TaxID=1808958 RepID=A0AAW0EZS0_9TRYP
MLRGDYAGALAAYRGVADIADLEPGLLPASMRREAAASAVTGGAASVQVARLVRECERCLRVGVTEPLLRVRLCKLGIDTVLCGGGTGAACKPLRRCVSAVEMGSGRTRAVSICEPDDTRKVYAAPRERCVTVTLDNGVEERHAFGCDARTLRDNFSMEWLLPQGPAHPVRRGPWNTRYVVLGISGFSSFLSFLPFRTLRPVVARAIQCAPPGTMSEALRSAVPVCQASRKHRMLLDRLVAAHQEHAHPNIDPIIAYSTSVEGGVAIFSEFSAGGVMRECHTRYPQVRPLTVVQWSFGLLSALAFLHERGFAHGGVSLDNVLVEADGTSRLKRFYPDFQQMQRRFCMSRTCYVSPLMAAGAAPTPACDMFCYGLLSLELMSRRRAWTWGPSEEGRPGASPEDLKALLKAGGDAFGLALQEGRVVVHVELLHQRTVTSQFSPLARETVLRCLSDDPAARPTAVEVRLLLKAALLASGVQVCE